MKKKSGLSIQHNSNQSITERDWKVEPKSTKFCSFDTSLVKCFVKERNPSHGELQNIRNKSMNLNIQCNSKLGNEPDFNSSIKMNSKAEKSAINPTFIQSEEMIFICDLEKTSNNDGKKFFNGTRKSINHSRQNSKYFGELQPIYESEDDNEKHLADISLYHYQDSELDGFNTPRLKISEERKSINFSSPLIKGFKDKKESIFSTECTNEDSRHNSQKSLNKFYSKSIVLTDGDDKNQRNLNMTSRPFYPEYPEEQKDEFSIPSDCKSERKLRVSTESSAGTQGKQNKGRKRLPDDNLEKYQIHVDKILNDSRTTLMVRNIANKYDYYLFLSMINEEFEGKYDFFYLPVDFKVSSPLNQEQMQSWVCFHQYPEPKRYLPLLSSIQ